MCSRCEISQKPDEHDDKCGGAIFVMDNIWLCDLICKKCMHRVGYLLFCVTLQASTREDCKRSVHIFNMYIFYIHLSTSDVNFSSYGVYHQPAL